MILVTGATGLVGSHLLHELLLRRESVRATKRAASNLNDVALAFSFYNDESEKLLNNVDWVDCNLLNPEEVASLFTDVKKVFHCAAAVSFNPKDEDKLIEINPAITANLVNAGVENNIDHFAHVSSVAAIGRTKSGEDCITESTEWKNGPENSKYAIGKYLSELEVWRGIEEGLTAAIINPTVILGAGNWNHSSNALFKKFSKPNLFFTAGGNGFVDVRDLVIALLKVSDEKVNAQRFIVVGENVSYRTLTTKILTEFGQKAPRFEAKKWLMNVLWKIEKLRSILFKTIPLVTKETANTSLKTWRYSNKKAQKLLGVKFRPVEQSIIDFAAFYRKLL